MDSSEEEEEDNVTNKPGNTGFIIYGAIMAQKTINKALGLRSFKNELTLPDGSLITGDNVIIDRDNVIEPRRGFGLYGDFGVDEDRAKQLLQYKDTLLLHYEDTLLYDDGNGNFSQFDGVYEELSAGLRIKGIETSGNFYFTTANGVKKISATNSSEFTTDSGYIIDAGAAKALDGTGVADTGTPGFMGISNPSGGFYESACAYRIVWGYKDVNEVLILGSPSEYFIVRNLSTTSSAVVDLTFTIPPEIVNDDKWFYQIYRAALVDDSTDPGTALPQDEMNLVFEDFPTTTDFTNGYVETSDITPEDFRDSGAPLYTNPVSGDGILQSNDRPPLAQDIAVYKGSTFYANTKTRHQKQVALISTALLADGDTLIIGDSNSGDTTYTFRTAGEDIAANEVYLAVGGSVGQNIDDTTRSLQRVINRNSGVVNAFYLSGPDDVPGQLLFEARELEDIAFWVKVGTGVNGGAFNPSLPTTDTELSSNTVQPNRIYFSKESEPEAVPIVNYFDVGEKDERIQRIVALRDSLFILKGDGIFRLSGNDISNFTVSLQDASSTIIAPDSVAVLNNQIFMISTQGVVSIPESGYPIIISRDIEDLILKPTSIQYTGFMTATFGVGYESDRSYIIHMPTVITDTVATQAYRYNVFTKAWTRYFSDKQKTCGLVSSADDKLYLGVGDTNQIEKERKDFSRIDYSDREYDNSFPAESINGTTLGLSTLQNVGIADTVYQEMYITISRFNRVLRKLDNDIGLTDTDYNSTLEMSSGDSLNNVLSILISKINADDTSRSYTAPSGSNDFSILRDEFNLLMNELNNSTQTFYFNYRSYYDIVAYESIITEISKSNNSVIVVDELPFIQGANIIYEAIISTIEWTPITLDEASLLKHFREATVMFDQYNFNLGLVEFRTDIADAYEGTTFIAEGNGAYGSQVYGEDVFGGLANQRPFRTYVPRNKQRCRFIIVRFTHKGSREKYAVTGYSVTYKEQASERAYKR